MDYSMKAFLIRSKINLKKNNSIHEIYVLGIKKAGKSPALRIRVFA
jgi:hypothetical protein